MTWEAVLELVDGYLSYRQQRRRAKQDEAVERQKQACLEQYRETQGQLCDALIVEGRKLAELRKMVGAYGWVAAVREMGMDPDTARRKVALFWFAKRHPMLYERLRELGPTYVGQVISHLEEVVERLQPEVRVRLPRGEVRFKELTHREAKRYVRELCPPLRRSPWDVLHHQARALDPCIDRAAKVPSSGETTRSTAGLLMDAARRVAELSNGDGSKDPP